MFGIWITSSIRICSALVGPQQGTLRGYTGMKRCWVPKRMSTAAWRAERAGAKLHITGGGFIGIINGLVIFDLIWKDSGNVLKNEIKLNILFEIFSNIWNYCSDPRNSRCESLCSSQVSTEVPSCGWCCRASAAGGTEPPRVVSTRQGSHTLAHSQITTGSV